MSRSLLIHKLSFCTIERAGGLRIFSAFALASDCRRMQDEAAQQLLLWHHAEVKRNRWSEDAERGGTCVVDDYELSGASSVIGSNRL